jgi:hypothetical protein
MKSTTIGREGAHERHLQMRMRVDPAGHHVAARGIKHLVADKVVADMDDDAPVDQHIRLVGQVGRHDGAVLDDCAHWPNSLSILGAP